MTQTKKIDGKTYKLHELHTSKKEANECAKQLREDLALHARITKGGNNVDGYGYYVWVRK